MTKEKTPLYCIGVGLIGYFVGASFAVDPITTSETIGTGLAVVSMMWIGVGAGILLERRDKNGINTKTTKNA